MKTGKEKEVTKNERVNGFSEYVKLSERFGVFDMSRIKYIGSNFLKGFDGAFKARSTLMAVKTKDEMNEFVDSL